MRVKTQTSLRALKAGAVGLLTKMFEKTKRVTSAFSYENVVCLLLKCLQFDIKLLKLLWHLLYYIKFLFYKK